MPAYVRHQPTNWGTGIYIAVSFYWVLPNITQFTRIYQDEVTNIAWCVVVAALSRVYAYQTISYVLRSTSEQTQRQHYSPRVENLTNS